MTAKPVVPRARARLDIEQAVDWYAREAGEQVAVGFVDAVERAWRAIAANPALGSPLHAHELNLPGLRTQRLRRYPYLVFYIDRGDHVDIWRVLHAQRDIPASMQEGEG
ncbi:type II toxin-antitoxin system RelE/ParE family toxin [Sphingomonas oligophenolica]|uniref:Type II toxin-antitoxin system RelE/ParE family toxin n=1 Tax=Sphingomonas oligophenolica TaxID=301154 RepID=A0ABU9Y0T0_9SPHN